MIATSQDVLVPDRATWDRLPEGRWEDYAPTGIAEYWIVNPADREVEVYRLQAGEYVLVETANTLKPLAFPEVEVDMSAVWSVLD